MNPNQAFLPNGITSEYQALKSYSTEQLVAEIYRRSDVDAVPHYGGVQHLDGLASVKPSLEYFNLKLEEMMDVSVSGFYNRLSGNFEPEECQLFSKINKLIIQDCYKFQDRVYNSIAQAKRRYSELENFDAMEFFLRQQEIKLDALEEELSQETVDSINAIAVDYKKVYESN